MRGEKTLIQVYKSNILALTNYTEEQAQKIMDDLTLDNPKYKQAKKYSKWKNTKIPKYLFYYQQEGETLFIPSGYKIPFKNEIIEDSRAINNVVYPPFKLKLRETQQEAFDSYMKDTEKGLICMPTGKGKSIFGLYLASQLKQKTLIIVHKEDLVVGWKKDIKLCFDNKVKSGLIKAKSRKIGDQITIATVQTLNRLTDEEITKLCEEFGLVIIDECHHIASTSYDLLNLFSSKYKVGLSATPTRNDGMTKVMHYYLGDFGYKYDYDKEADSEEDILPVEVRLRNDIFKYEPKVKKVGNKYVIDDKNGTIPISTLNINVRPRVVYSDLEDKVVTSHLFSKLYINDIKEEYKQGHSCLVLVKLKNHCRFIKEKLIEIGVPEDDIQLYYGDSDESKDILINRAENNRQLITIATLVVATEGTNVKQWEVEFLVSSVANEIGITQAIGRIRRTINKPKLDVARVYDYRHPYVYSMKNHGRIRNKVYTDLHVNYSIYGKDKANTNKNLKSLFTRGYKKK